MTDLNWLVSGSAHDINWWQMSVRAIVVFLYGLVVIRVAGRRAFGKNSAIDIVLAIIIGSSLGRALTGNAALPPALVAMTALALLHEVLARLCVHWKWLGYLMKGEARQIVRGGQTNSATMKFKSLSDGDLIEAVRLHGRLTAVGDVKEAHLDLNGQISGLESRNATSPAPGCSRFLWPDQRLRSTCESKPIRLHSCRAAPALCTGRAVRHQMCGYLSSL